MKYNNHTYTIVSVVFKMLFKQTDDLFILVSYENH
jgi:hypothetical protein